jgi:hypothetical protein
MQRLAKLETHQRLYYIAKCVGVIGLRSGGVVRCRTTALPVVKLTVTLLLLSYREACSNTQHCSKLQTYCCTSVSTKLIEIPAHQVIIIAVTDGYTSFSR